MPTKSRPVKRRVDRMLHLALWWKPCSRTIIWQLLLQVPVLWLIIVHVDIPVPLTMAMITVPVHQCRLRAGIHMSTGTTGSSCSMSVRTTNGGTTRFPSFLERQPQRPLNSFWFSRSYSSLSRRQHRFSFMASTTTRDRPNDDQGKDDLNPQKEEAQQQHDDVMYVLGVNLARQLGDIRPLLVSPDNDNNAKEQYTKELTQVTAGIVDTIIGRVNEEQQIALLQQHGNSLNALIQERALALQEKLVQAGREMLQIMSETDGAITIPQSNVVVHILNRTDDTTIPNCGVRPTKSSIVKMHYHGTLADGTIFDSSYIGTKNNGGIEPINVPIAKLIPGLREGMVQHMTVGDTAMIGIPPAVGYGLVTTPPNPNIPDNSTLFYKVQLIDVLTAGIGGEQRNVPTLLNADGTKLTSSSSSTLLGANGRPLV